MSESLTSHMTGRDIRLILLILQIRHNSCLIIERTSMYEVSVVIHGMISQTFGD